MKRESVQPSLVSVVKTSLFSLLKMKGTTFSNTKFLPILDLWWISSLPGKRSEALKLGQQRVGIHPCSAAAAMTMDTDWKTLASQIPRQENGKKKRLQVQSEREILESNKGAANGPHGPSFAHARHHLQRLYMLSFSPQKTCFVL